MNDQQTVSFLFPKFLDQAVHALANTSHKQLVYGHGIQITLLTSRGASSTLLFQMRLVRGPTPTSLSASNHGALDCAPHMLREG